MNNNYYLGLDLGTNSVGWAVTDDHYNIIKFHGKHMWGMRLFEEAETAKDRRLHRQARRRRQRLVERINLLEELFDKEISKVDQGFFARKKESDLHFEDKTTKSEYALFNDKSYTDRDYYKQYPTIFHLIMDLIENDKKRDIRLVYLACHYLIKHRGHFIFDGKNFTVDNSFENLLDKLITYLKDNDDITLSFPKDQLINIFKNSNLNSTEKSDQLKPFFGRTNLEKGIIKLLSGGKQDLSNMFRDETLKNSNYKNLKFSDNTFDDERDGYAADLGDRINLLILLKQIYDASILESMMSQARVSIDGHKYISSAKVCAYEKHKSDLKRLKSLIKKYLPSEYNNIFRKITEKDNYVAYSKSNITNNKREKALKYVEYVDFTKYLTKKLKTIKTQDAEDDKEIFEIKGELEKQSFLPKQRTLDNSIIPYQLHLMELKKILDNQSKYYDFLLAKDDQEGITVKDKIISLLTFRLPYYIGPVNPAVHGKFAWVKRLANGKVTPWNYKEKIDIDASHEEFIKTKLSKCSFLIGCDVLPKNSLLYQKYMVLSELNTIKFNGVNISEKLKDDIYQNLFKNIQKVTKKRLQNYIKEHENIIGDVIVTGIDNAFKQGLVSYLKFKKIIGDKIDDDRYQKVLEKIIRDITLYDECAGKKIKKEYKDSDLFTEDELNKIVKLTFNDWGRLSAELLDQLEGEDTVSGETGKIIEFMQKHNYNLMQLMSKKFTFKYKIDEINKSYYQHDKFNYKSMIDSLYVSPATKRILWQSLKVVHEISKIMKHDPEKIFIEMARSKEDHPKRKLSRKADLKQVYKDSKKQIISIIGKDKYQDLSNELDNKDDRDLRWDNLYLYYTQLGRSMYSLKPIDISELMNKNLYDQDHIFPKSKKYDDSIENRVLVEKELNVKKSDIYPISDANIITQKIKGQVESFWKMLYDHKLIGDKKYARLIRSKAFTDDELAGFIARQLVETRQATKETADLLKRLCPKSRIVYAKAQNASIFRQKFDIPKSRTINDLHHAQDAYLNIVVGNIFDTKFTQDPRNFIKNTKDSRNYNLEKIYDYNVERNNYVAWIAPDSKTNGTIANVKCNLSTKNFRVTRPSFYKKGALFNQNLSRKGSNLAPIKEHSPKSNPLKYGGYSGKNNSFFVVVAGKDNKGKDIVKLIPVNTLIYNKMLHCDYKAKQELLTSYVANNFAINNFRIVKDDIKMYSLVKIDGAYYYLVGGTDERIEVKNAMQLLLSKDSIKAVKILEKESKDQFANIKNYKDIDIKLGRTFNEVVSKYTNSVFGKSMLISDKYRKDIFKSVEKSILEFNHLDTIGKADNLLKFVTLMRPSGSAHALKMVGLIERIRKSNVISNFNEFKLINQSVTGLFENEEDLLKL